MRRIRARSASALARVVVAVVALAGACGPNEGDADRTDAGVDGARADGDDTRIVPQDLTVTALAGGNGVLELVALTLREGPNGVELYAALTNEGDRPACHAALSVELFDRNEQSLAATIGGLLTQRLYRLADGTGSVAACVAPGEVTMAALVDFPSELAVDDVGYVVYRCPYFALDVTPTDGVVIDELEPVKSRAGTAYTGVLKNELDVAVSNPSVSVFARSRAGRPLGVATARAAIEVAPSGSWSFETDPLATPGFDQLAFPAGALSGRASVP